MSMTLTEQIITRLGNVECWLKKLIEDGVGGGLGLPAGGNEGDALIKQGSGLAWGSPPSGGGLVFQRASVVVEEDGQEFFYNIFPQGKNVFSVEVEGFPQILNVDYQIVANAIKWISADPAELLAGFVVTVVYY